MPSHHNLEGTFPELTLIKNTTLREKVSRVWTTAQEKGGWTRLEDVPFTLLVPNSGRLIDHTRRITKLAYAVADVREDTHNTDYLVAGALLHDVGKLLEYEMVNGKVDKRRGQTQRHPALGAALAQEIGLPPEVVLIIAAHSHEGDTMDRTPEAIIVHHCDFIDFDILKRRQHP
jgi:putative nucleotidyltransferase with HDIG domain